VNPALLWIDPEAEQTRLALEVRKTFPRAKVHIGRSDPRALHRGLPAYRILRISVFSPPALREVRESERSVQGRPEGYLACGAGCPAGCSYCVLSVCCPVTVPTLYGNVEGVAADLARTLEKGDPWYLHLGHIFDPLAYRAAGPMLRAVVGTVADFPHAHLEIRSKFTSVDLLPEPAPANVTVAFSVAPKRVVREAEPRTASLEARLQAARKAAGKGYAIGFRLDPILLYEGWEKDYSELCRRLINCVPPHCVRDVVLGLFRGPPELITALGSSSAPQVVRSGEFVPTGSGKYSYGRPFRLQALRFLAARMGGRFAVRFCFDRYEIEEAVYARPPSEAPSG